MLTPACLCQLQPLLVPEKQIHLHPDQHHQHYRALQAARPVEFGKIAEIHAEYAGDEGERQKGAEKRGEHCHDLMGAITDTGPACSHTFNHGRQSPCGELFRRIATQNPSLGGVLTAA
jgi:hypothetical protein